MTEGGTHPGKKLTNYSEIEYQLLHDLHWLPDGSGFLYSTTTLMRDASNIFHFDFKTKQTTQLTNFENAFAKKFSISPMLHGSCMNEVRSTTTMLLLISGFSV
jgi:Tol biopolymer transport system component